jgi:hypothetical protein
MDIGRHLITAALNRHGALGEFIDAGFDMAWLTDKEDLSRAAIFSETDIDAYRFILKSREKNGTDPSLDYFRHSFPAASFKLEKSGMTTGELLAAAIEDRKGVQLHVAGSTFIDLHDEGKFDEALALMAAEAERIGRTAGGGSLPFRMIPLSGLDDLPDPEPLIEGTLDRGTVTMLSGPSGSGKSFLALDWSCSAASGTRWLGNAVTPCRVLYLAAEGGGGMKARVAAWRQEHGKVDDEMFTMIIDPVQFGDPSALSALITIAAGYDFVIIDTVARCSVGLEENSARDMGQFIDGLYKLRDAREEGGTTVLVVHHTGYDTSRARASSAIQAGVDNVYHVESPAADPHILFTLKATKRKDGPLPAERTLKLCQVEVGRATSCVIEEAGEEWHDGPAVAVLLKPDIGQTVKDLAGQMDVSKQAAEKQLKGLEAEGLARREHGRGNHGDLWYSDGEE